MSPVVELGDGSFHLKTQTNYLATNGDFNARDELTWRVLEVFVFGLNFFCIFRINDANGPWKIAKGSWIVQIQRTRMIIG